MMFAKKEAPLSYSAGPRLDRALNSLSAEDRKTLGALYNKHVVDPVIQTVQRRGQFLYVVSQEADVIATSVFDFGAVAAAQSFLIAMTDCLREQRAPVRVLAPTAPPAP